MRLKNSHRFLKNVSFAAVDDAYHRQKGNIFQKLV